MEQCISELFFNILKKIFKAHKDHLENMIMFLSNTASFDTFQWIGIILHSL